MQAAPDQQISLTDPDARSMATSGKGTGIVGYNVQTAVDAKHHLIVAHEVTNVGHDRGQLATMAQQAQRGDWARAADGARPIAATSTASEILACERAGIAPLRAQAADLEQPRPRAASTSATSSTTPSDDEYRCPAGQTADLAVHDASRTA